MKTKKRKKGRQNKMLESGIKGRKDKKKEDMRGRKRGRKEAREDG